MKTTTKTTTLAVFVAAVMLSVPVAAEEARRGFYIAPEIGQVKIKDYCADVRAVSQNVTSCDESELGFGLAGGYQFNDFFAVEGGGRFASGFKISETLNGITSSIETDIRSFSIGARGNFPIGQHFLLTGKAGFHFWNYKVKESGAGSATVDGEDPYYGVGAQFNFNEKMGVRAEWTRYVAKNQNDNSDLDVISGSLVVNF